MINLTEEEREKLKLDIICTRDLADTDGWLDMLVDNIEDMIQKKVNESIIELKPSNVDNTIKRMDKLQYGGNS